MSTLAVILARGNSKGIPRNNILPFCGKPLIAWSILQARGSASIDEVWVSSDSAEILAAAESYGAASLVCPKDCAIDTADAECALIHMIDSWRAQRGGLPKRIVLLQATSPLRRVNDIDKAIETSEREAADTVFSASLLEGGCIWSNINGDYRPVTYDYKNRSLHQDRKPMVLENGSIYVCNTEVLLRERNRLGGKIAVHLMEGWQSYEIEGPKDVELGTWYFEHHRLAAHPFNSALSVSQIDLVVYDFDGVMTDNTVWVDRRGEEQVRVNRSDGLGIKAIAALGLKQLMLSTEAHPVVAARAAKLNIPVSQNCADKANWLKSHCLQQGILLDRVLYVGNDLNDIEVMRLVGWPVCPADARAEVLSIARVVLTRCGGAGIVQELADHLVHVNASGL